MKKSAGILLYKIENNDIKFFLVHPGGPYFKKKDLGSWSIPKGECGENEELLNVAKREFLEEIGQEIEGEPLELTPIKQKGGKIVHAWAIQGDLNPKEIKSNFFEIEFPPKSGKKQSFPEVDRGEWFNFSTAKQKINEAQSELIDDLVKRLNILPNINNDNGLTFEEQNIQPNLF